jgi:hypothetical protein
MILALWIKPAFVGKHRFNVKEVRSTPYSCLVIAAPGEGDGLEAHGFACEGEKYDGIHWYCQEPVSHNCTAN